MPFTLILALVLRLLLWSQPLHQPANDEVEYITVARDLLAGRGWSFYEHYHWLRAPLYNLFLAGSLWLAGGDPASDAALHRAALPNIILSVATVYLSYRLTLALVGRRPAARVAALLTAILWTLATFASLYMAETLFTFLFTAALLCLVRGTMDDGPTTNDQQPTTNDQQLSPAPRAPRPAPHRSLWWIVAAGALLGLATLTRSVTLLFLPVVALWLLLRTTDDGRRTMDDGRWTGDGEEGDSKPRAPRLKRLVARRAIAPAVFLLVATAAIAPWTIRNYLAYGRPILVETGLSYNLWAFNEPREEQETIFRVLENIPNPADRSDYATARGLARLREDPLILARKLWPGWIYLWRVKPIEDRFIQESYYGDVGLPMFTAAFVFDDVLGLLIALAGMAGLVLYWPAMLHRPPQERGWQRLLAAMREPKLLMVLWMFYTVSTTLLTHAETRYRHFLYPILIPYAAWLLTRFAGAGRRPAENGSTAGVASVPARGGASIEQVIGIALLWTLLGVVWLDFYPRDWAIQSMRRGWHALAAEVYWAAGDHAAALREDERALAAHKTPDGWIRLGNHARAAGDSQRALKAYRSAVALAPPYVAAVAHFGDLLRALGDDHAAREAFVGDYVDQQRLADWSWRNLDSAASMVAVGDGLDFGYVGGMYLPERQAGALVRWTNGRGQLRLEGAPGPALLRLRLAAPRPPGVEPEVQVCVSGGCQALDLGPEWRIYNVEVDIAEAGPLLVEIRSDTFVAAEGRRLGVLVDSAGLGAVEQP